MTILEWDTGNVCITSNFLEDRILLTINGETRLSDAEKELGKACEPIRLTAAMSKNETETLADTLTRYAATIK